MSPRSVEAIVESQVQRWIGERTRSPAPPPQPMPVVAVSRQFGAGGAACARLVADRLGFTFWNRELLAAIAGHAHLEASTLARFDEHHRSVLIDAVGGMLPTASSLGLLDYARELTRVVRDVVQRGGAVLVGRGAGYLIDPARVLRVRVVCPIDERVRRVAARDGLDLEAARRHVLDADADRRAFVRDLYGKDLDDVAGHDLWVNTGSLPVELSASVIVAAYRARFGERVVHAGA